MKRFTDFLIRCIVLSGALTLACGGSNPVQPKLQIVADLVIATGDAQVDTVGQTLPTAVTIQAKNAVGGVVPAVVLNWFTITNDGVNCVGCSDTVFVGAGLTDETGGARLRWTLRTRAGPQGLIACAIDAEGDCAVHIKATAEALHDRATTIATWDQPALIKAGGIVLLSAHAGGNDQYGNYAGVPNYGSLPAGWRVSGDTAYAPMQTGDYTLPLVLDQARGSFVARVQ